tara:strand:+ start:27 stop:299 length:273 start_codon:yes stop_codon:yes gene_type:complete
MGTVQIKIKIMPTSPEADLEEIKENTKKILEEKKAEAINFEEEPVAFGLKAVITGFSMDESQELDPIEEGIRKIETVSSAETIDMRRAFG